MDPDQFQNSKNSNKGISFTTNNELSTNEQNNINSNNYNQPYSNTNNNNFSNYYNPITIQNYYSMINAKNLQNQGSVQMNNFYSTPYNLNKVTNTMNTQNINTILSSNFHQPNFNTKPHFFQNIVNNSFPHNLYKYNNIQAYPQSFQNEYKGSQLQNNFIQNMNFINYQNKYYQMQNNGVYPQNIHLNNYYKQKIYANNNKTNNQSFNYNNYNETNQTNQNIPSKNKKSKIEDDPSEIEKWLENRKRKFPSADNVKDKVEYGKIKEDAGMISKLELKLRERIKLMNSINKKAFVKNRPNRNRRRKRNKMKNKIQKSNEIEEGEIIEVLTEKNTEINENTRNEKIKQEAFKKQDNKHNSQLFKEKDNMRSDKPKIKLGFKYRRNKIYDELIKSDKLKEMNIILQAFRYFINEKLI